MESRELTHLQGRPPRSPENACLREEWEQAGPEGGSPTSFPSAGTERQGEAPLTACRNRRGSGRKGCSPARSKCPQGRHYTPGLDFFDSGIILESIPAPCPHTDTCAGRGFCGGGGGVIFKSDPALLPANLAICARVAAARVCPAEVWCEHGIGREPGP